MLIMLSDSLTHALWKCSCCRHHGTSATPLPPPLPAVTPQVCQELEHKASANELQQIERQQAVVNSGFAQNLHLGRWLWKSAKTKAGGAVPWDVQAVNTDSDNYVWEEGKVCVWGGRGGRHGLY